MKIVEKIVKFILALFNKKDKAESHVNQRVIENSEEKILFSCHLTNPAIWVNRELFPSS